MKHPVFVHTGSSHVFSEQYFTRVDISDLGAVDMATVSCWLIDDENPDRIRSIIEAIRQHPSPAIYLRGIVLLSADENTISPSLSQAVDLCRSKSSFDSIVAKEFDSNFSALNQWIDHSPNPTEHSDVNISFKILRFITSRGIELQPLMTTSVHCGYDYPAVSAMLNKDDNAILETLSFLEQQRLLAPRFITKTHLCNHCDSAFLNFKEICPDCQSEDISSEELIHHFKCAYVGQISEFTTNEKLSCPKCDTPLQHIGVDYDKPSILFNCGPCGHSFQEPSITSTCFSCGRSSPPENQIAATINAYKATAIGQNAAIYGIESLFTNILKTKLNLFTQPAFRDFIDIEMARIARYKTTNSTLVMVQFSNIEALHIRLGMRAGEVFSEISTIFKTILRQSDVVSARNESIFFMLLTETDLVGAQLVADRLSHEVTQLFENNLDYQPTIKTQTTAINDQFKLDATLESFIQHDVP